MFVLSLKQTLCCDVMIRAALTSHRCDFMYCYCSLAPPMSSFEGFSDLLLSPILYTVILKAYDIHFHLFVFFTFLVGFYDIISPRQPEFSVVWGFLLGSGRLLSCNENRLTCNGNSDICW